MRKYLTIIFISAFAVAKAQITLEHTYDSASTIASIGPQGAEQSQLMIINFEVSGERYVRINKWGKSISVYDMNHSLLKTIFLSSFPMSSSNQIGVVLYFSEKLFDLDAGMEFMYGVQTPSIVYTGIYNDDGSLIFSDTCAPMILPNIPTQQYPIYNTSQGTKMILSYYNNIAKVFSLQGTLSTAIQEGNSQLMQAQGISNPYPNPTNSTTRIDYKLPDGVNQGEILFYDLQGNEIKRFKVDRTFDTLLISTSDIPAGTYYYQLQTASQASEGKKMVVVK